MEVFLQQFLTNIVLNSGVITVEDELDFELKETYQLTLRATDSVTGAYSEVYLSIKVTDVNDCPPEFPQSQYTIKVSESVPPATEIFHLEASDRDSTENAKIMYMLTQPDGNGTDYFFMDPDEGRIFTKQHLDHETMPNYNLIVTATDSGNPPLNTTAHIWIKGRLEIIKKGHKKVKQN